MMRSMFAGVSGLQAHQLMMDVVGDNIANINTAGFKSSRVVFEDTLSQLMSGASAPSAALGGTNAKQIGLGVRVGAIDQTDTQGALQTTGRPTDLAISGNGAFAVRSGAETLYTRAGSFSFDASGNLTDPTGAIVQGWLADPATHTISTGGAIGDVKIPLDAPIAAVATSSVGLGGNLSAGAQVGDPPVTTTMTIFDNLGTSHDITISMTKTAANTWSASVADENGNSLGPATTMNFDPSTGKLTSTSPSPASYTLSPTGVTPSTFVLNFNSAGTSGGVTQYGGDSTAVATEQDGSAGASLRSYSISDDGTVTGVFSNGKSQVLAQVAIATFPNQAGLMKAGQGHFRTSAASGNPLLNAPGTGTAGTVVAGSLEMSNVDLASEFTNMIIAQRGFQANSKVISTSDRDAAEPGQPQAVNLRNPATAAASGIGRRRRGALPPLPSCRRAHHRGQQGGRRSPATFSRPRRRGRRTSRRSRLRRLDLALGQEEAPEDRAERAALGVDPVGQARDPRGRGSSGSCRRARGWCWPGSG